MDQEALEIVQRL